MKKEIISTCNERQFLTTKNNVKKNFVNGLGKKQSRALSESFFRDVNNIRLLACQADWGTHELEN